MKKTRNNTFAILTLLIGFIFLLDSCGPTYVHKNRSVVYRRVPSTKVVVVRPYSPPPRPVRANVRIGY